MPFIVSEDIADEDFDSLFAIQYKAFSNQPALKACSPEGLDNPGRSENVARFINVLGWKESNVVAAKVVDDETGEICAFATMRVCDGNPFAGAKDSDIHCPQVDEGMRSAVEWTLNTKNDRCATLLVKWAARIIDEKGSRAMVEASKDATQYGLYSKQGFRIVDTYDYIDEQKFPGFEGMYVVPWSEMPKTDRNLVRLWQ
ncbi:hypothetical protein HO133_006229 [Letharia lupina]|uniref:N-acetyltransferase domain-containing protein n=1 Tax=Letharia lupina TaxID=560253 RepID=A0A8H6C798_9LECA|nr:uncharacterized protein HO133_006229 [Letharia lupina]KAF6218267.1 hypothetical protein HO133_006229 [Letharia lupina]